MPSISLLCPLGELTVHEESGVIVSLDWGRGRDQAPTPMLRRVRDQLNGYFDGDPTPFDLPLGPCGTVFRKRAWAALVAVPRGTTTTYGRIAAQLGTSARAVGQACATNPIPILIPCHRVIGADGTIGFYSGGDGPATKSYLLDLERPA